MIENLVITILSGGVGSRLWPLSRKSCPKQYLKIFDEKSLFQLAVERNLVLTNKMIVVGNKDNYKLSLSTLEPSNSELTNIVEALPKNTAAAIAFAAFAVKPEEILLVTPSDHIIEDVKEYQNSVSKAVSLAKEGFIVTFGIKPHVPETGYGYIESEGVNVLSFREKPDRETAEKFLNSGNFYWNSGMFCFKASVMLEELKTFEPLIYETAEMAWKNSNDGQLRPKDMEKIPSKSIDYAVMERSRKIKVVAGDFGWSDLGSFESLYDYFSTHGNQPDEHGNMYIGNGRFTEFLGVEDTLLIQTEDANLVLKKQDAQQVKNIYEKLEKEGSNYII